MNTYGVTFGTSAQDWVGPELSKEELTPYFGPNDNDLDESRILEYSLDII